MACRVYSMGIHQDGKRYEADVILLDRAVRGALENRSMTEKIFDGAVVSYRRLRKLPGPGYREPHAVKQYLVNQFNSAILNSQEYQDFKRLEAERKAEASHSRHPKSVTIPKGFKPIELRHFHELAIVQGRRATICERMQFMVLGLLNIPEALTPSAKPANDSEKE